MTRAEQYLDLYTQSLALPRRLARLGEQRGRLADAGALVSEAELIAALYLALARLADLENDCEAVARTELDAAPIIAVVRADAPPRLD